MNALPPSQRKNTAKDLCLSQSFTWQGETGLISVTFDKSARAIQIDFDGFKSGSPSRRDLLLATVGVNQRLEAGERIADIQSRPGALNEQNRLLAVCLLGQVREMEVMDATAILDARAVAARRKTEPGSVFEKTRAAQ